MVASFFETQVFETLRDKEVEVSLIGGQKLVLVGRLYTAQKDYVMLTVGDGSPKNTFVIPTSAIAYIRQTT